jgi:hypothetical protein
LNQLVEFHIGFVHRLQDFLYFAGMSLLFNI